MANVLLVDPDEIAFLALKGFLARGQHRCAAVVSQEDALSFIRENLLVDLVIMELRLEESTGLGLLRALRSDYFFQNIPVVFYAAKTTPDEIRQAFSMKVQNFLRKPYQEDIIQEEANKVKGQAWYWSGFETDEAYGKRTAKKRDQRRGEFEGLVKALKVARGNLGQIVDTLVQMAEITKEMERAEKERLLAEFSKLHAPIQEVGIPGLMDCVKHLEGRIRAGGWSELKHSLEYLDFYGVLIGYRLDMYELDRRSEEASALLERLGRNAVLRSLPPSEVHALVPFVRDFNLEEGATLFRQGDVGDAMYLVDRGRLGVYITMEGALEPKRIAEIADGDIVGEMALITGAPRSATIIAQADCHTMRVEKADFDRVLMMSPQMKRAVQSLAANRSMDSIKKKAGEIDISDWAKTATEGVRRMGERVPSGFLGKEEADAKREAANLALWNSAVDKGAYPVVSERTLHKELGGLATCPVIESSAAAFSLAANGTEASLHPLMDLVEKDPGLIIQILQSANEIRQAKRKDLTTFLEDARMGVGYLGEKRLSGMGKAMPPCRESFMYINEELNWQSHMRFLNATSKIAVLTCQQLELPNLEHVAALAALIHDFGKLLLLRLHPAGFLHIFQYAQENKVPVWESEMLHLEMTTRQMALEFAETHCFPSRFKSVVRWVENPEAAAEDVDLVNVVAIARHMCRLCRVGFSGESNYKEVLPLEHTQLWRAIRDRVFPSFQVSKFEALIRSRCREL
jgi:CRP-like cAMP-binding protein/FixJ family two-component response regulator/HD-like signal output (HDOD) protein